MLDAKLEQVESRLHHHRHGEPRLGSAMGDPQCCLMENDIGRLHQRGHQICVANISVDQPHGATDHGLLEIFRPAPHQIVERHDLRIFAPGFAVCDVDHSLKAGLEEELFDEIGYEHGA